MTGIDVKILNHFVIIIVTLIALMANAQNKIEIMANDRTMTATLADTEAARQLLTRLDNGPVTIRMNDYGGFEKVGDLPWSLPTSNRQITTSAGDIMLYQGDNIVIFYGPNSWSYTPLGRIDGAGATEIRDFLSGSSINVTFAKQGQSGIDDITADTYKEPEIYTLQGRRITLAGRKISDLPKGIYIINGKKQLIK